VTDSIHQQRFNIRFHLLENGIFELDLVPGVE
jgi:hypothetical protein